METLEGFEHICEFPPSDHKWEMTNYNGVFYFFNPDHPPMMLVDGKLEEVGFSSGHLMVSGLMCFDDSP